MANIDPIATTPNKNDDYFELAKAALARMLADHGSEYKFPADVIWLNTPAEVAIPSLSRPHIPKKLLASGHLELTGAVTKAQSEKRAGSPTKEYRFGPAIVPHAQPASIALSAKTSAPAHSGHFNASVALVRIQSLMDSEGYMVSTAELANFFLAMTVSPLVILSGISGTGKSLLPRKFAQRTQSRFHQIPVQPQWADNTDLFGYVPTLAQGRFIEGKLIRGLLEAKAQPDKLVIAVLDEMNLAPVEHYFSDFLSVAETRARLNGQISSDELPIELPAIPTEGPDSQAALRGIRLPANLRVIGTANMDETTHTFSPKVLDRAFTIEFDDPDLTSFSLGVAADPSETFPELAQIVIRQTNAISVLEAGTKSQDVFEHIAALLAEIQDILSPAGIKFGYRTRDAILLYLHFWKELELSGIVTGYAALDFCILQKVLPKIAGSGEGLAEALKSLEEWLKARAEIEYPASGVEAAFAGPLERSHQKVVRMAALLDVDGATRFWGA
ncbi:MAG: AAA family ATPase [Rhodoferax sp.]|nr:AAA family ATPase [Rhodoferax sp.]